MAEIPAANVVSPAQLVQEHLRKLEKMQLPPSLDERMVSRHYGEDADTAPDLALQRCHTAMQLGRITAERARDFAIAMMKNQMLSEPARHAKAHDAAHGMTQRVLKEFDGALDQIKKQISTIERETNAPAGPKDLMAEMRQQEIRRALSMMDEKQRGSIIHAATATGDDFTVGAVLNAPAWLSALSPAEQELRRGAWRNARHGPSVERLERLRKAAADTQRGGQLLLNFAESLVDRRMIDSARKSEAEAQTALEALQAAQR